MSIRVQWLERVEEIGTLEAAWRALESATKQRSPLVSFDHLVPWYRHYGGRLGDPLLGAAWDGADLVAVAPLVRRRDRLGGIPVRRVDFAAHNAEAGEFLVAEDRTEAIAHFLRGLTDRAAFDVVSLKNLDCDSAHLRAIEEAAPEAGLTVERADSLYAVVDLSGGHDAYSKATGHRLRKDLKKRARRIEAAGGVALDGAHFDGDPSSAAAAVERCFAINDASWKARQRGPLAAHHRGFYRELCERFARRRMADVSILKIGREDAAYLIGVAERGVYYDMTVSFADRFAPLAPGFHLMEQVLRMLPGFGIHRLVSHGAHGYKQRWASDFARVRRLFLFPLGLRSGLSRLLKFRVAPALGLGGTEPLLD